MRGMAMSRIDQVHAVGQREVDGLGAVGGLGDDGEVGFAVQQQP